MRQRINYAIYELHMRCLALLLRDIGETLPYFSRGMGQAWYHLYEWAIW